MAPPDILYMHMEDPPAKHPDEPHVVDALVAKVGGIVVEAKTPVPPHRCHGALG